LRKSVVKERFGTMANEDILETLEVTLAYFRVLVVEVLDQRDNSVLHIVANFLFELAADFTCKLGTFLFHSGIGIRSGLG
jgi:hypothetical protein